ncbi:MAG: hypothetical protein FJ147_27590 [Deltaproteobacteria bacterium]|nr:hypothetical protein [Deltaproteobacteria bacterium]
MSQLAQVNSSVRPVIHLWIFNHPFYGISDQVEFFKLSFVEHGYPVSVGRQPRLGALNVVIENFSELSSEILCNFCRSTGKRVAVIMTEHLDFIGDRIFIHGEPLWQENDYMPSATQASRIKNLMDCAPYIRSFIVLGDLPELKDIGSIFSGIGVRQIPFPSLESRPKKVEEIPVDGHSDLVFTGYMTSYRRELLSEIAKKLCVACPEKFVSRKVRDSMNRNAKIVLNLPQRQGWRWVSLMRIIAALRCGRATISISTRDTSLVAACATQIDAGRLGWLDALQEHVARWESLYEQSLADYMRLVESFGTKVGFPDDLFDYWSIVEGLRDNAVP